MCLEEEEHEEDESVTWTSGRLAGGAVESAMPAVEEEGEGTGGRASGVESSFRVPELGPEKFGPNGV